jgi:hypothetical protein
MNDSARALPENERGDGIRPEPDADVEELARPSNLSGSPQLSVESIDTPSAAPGKPEFSPEEHRAKATKLLALLLFAALFLICVAHIVLVASLAHNKPNSVEEVTRVFNTWIPVFAGLFGSAATFYFTQGRK